MGLVGGGAPCSLLPQGPAALGWSLFGTAQVEPEPLFLGLRTDSEAQLAEKDFVGEWGFRGDTGGGANVRGCSRIQQKHFCQSRQAAVWEV